MEMVKTGNAAAFVEGLKSSFGDLSASRLRSVNELSEMDFPTVRNERWKYTRLTKFQKETFQINKSISTLNLSFTKDHSLNRIVFINGFFSQENSNIQEKGFAWSEMKDETILTSEFQSSLFTKINDAFFTSGLDIEIKENIDRPIEVVFISQGEKNTSQIRNRIRVAKGKQASFRFIFESADNHVGFTNVLTKVLVEQNAQLSIQQLQNENLLNYHFNTMVVEQEGDSRFTVNTFSLDAHLIRNNLFISSNGENTESNLNGLYITNGVRHVDNQTVMDHTRPHALSNELYKGIMDEQSSAAFNGKVFVRQDAQKINAYQSNSNILLSETAQVNSKPELEIYADDVKCSHGSTTGQLDEEALFYLQARGISEKSARLLLVQAFAGDVINKIEDEEFRLKVEEQIASKFNWIK
ncbi:MAG: Fe-S cluster assembly protein SufD [Flavobacteriales bacterium]|nr:Fe-S cluster assembly protein SufD [Flavobacteriales bacterium]